MKFNLKFFIDYRALEGSESEDEDAVLIDLLPLSFPRCEYILPDLPFQNSELEDSSRYELKNLILQNQLLESRSRQKADLFSLQKPAIHKFPPSGSLPGEYKKLKALRLK